MVDLGFAIFYTQCMYKTKGYSERLFSFVFIFCIAYLVAIGFLPEGPYTLSTAEGASVENATSIFALLGAYFCVKIFFLRKKYLSRFDFLFLLGGLAFLFVGGEEISWGQRTIGLRPIFDATELNDQRELTLHNFRALQGIILFGGLSTILIATGIMPLLSYFSKSVKKLYLKFGVPLMPKIVCAAVWIGLIGFVLALQVEYSADNLRNRLDELIELYFSFTLFSYIFADYFYLLKYKKPFGFELTEKNG